jgi:hypothetical protein
VIELLRYVVSPWCVTTLVCLNVFGGRRRNLRGGGGRGVNRHAGESGSFEVLLRLRYRCDGRNMARGSVHRLGTSSLAAAIPAHVGGQ